MLYLFHELEEKLDYKFNNIEILRRALTHPSYAAEQRIEHHNQRLEFLGDAVLQLAVTRALFLTHSEADEGVLSKMRAAMTNEEALAEIAGRLDLGRYIRLGRGEKKTGGNERPSMLADSMEAIFGAIYLDGGFDAAADTVEKMTEFLIVRGRELLIESNPKGALQEYTQEELHTKPVYSVVSVTGPDHVPSFTVSVAVGERTVAEATAGNRRKAEREAARMALEIMRLESGNGVAK